MANNVKFLLGFQLTPFILTGSISLAYTTGNKENEVVYVTRTEDGRIRYELAKGFKLPWGVSVGLSNIFSTANITISTLDSAGNKKTVKTITGGEFYESELKFGASQAVIIEGSSEIEFDARELRSRDI